MQSYIKLFIMVILTSLVSMGFAQETTSASGGADALSFPYMAEITGEDLYVRSGPGTNFYSCSKLNKGDKVKVVGKQFSWARIVPPAGSFSWISMQYVNIDPANPTIGTVTGDRVRVYAGSDNVEPLHSTTLQGKLDRGDQVKLLGEQMDDYYKIVPPSFAYLWISINFTKALPAEPVKPVVPVVKPSTTEPTTTPTIEKPTTEIKEPPKEVGPEPVSPETLLERYSDLQKQVEAERTKPIDKQNYTELKKALTEIAQNKTEDEAGRKAARYAEHVLKVIKDLELVLAVNKEVRLQNEQLQNIREKIQKSRATRQEKFQDLGSFAVVGKLQTFTTYGPGHYRIVNDSGKTICYALPSGIPQTELTTLLGQKVGLVGTIEPHKQTKGALVRFTKVVKLD
jgi:uncharacterized protein YgiM (DUF1202 family)